jgi:hypothetical protein
MKIEHLMKIELVCWGTRSSYRGTDGLKQDLYRMRSQGQLIAVLTEVRQARRSPGIPILVGNKTWEVQSDSAIIGDGHGLWSSSSRGWSLEVDAVLAETIVGRIINLIASRALDTSKSSAFLFFLRHLLKTSGRISEGRTKTQQRHRQLS